jgi:hypothetical protein
MRSLRFPEQYKEMLRTVDLLEQMFGEKIPIYHAWDTQVTSHHQASHLRYLICNQICFVQGHGLGTDDIKGIKSLKPLQGGLFLQKKEALQVLHDTGHILLAECAQGLCVCFKPQFIADMIAIFADPSCDAFGHGKLRACASKDTILRLLVENLEFKLRSTTNAATIFNFLLSIKVIIELDAIYFAPSSPSSLERMFMVPSALKGRPSFWREVLPRPVMCLRGLRFRSTRKIVTVGLFLRVMSSMVHNPDRMWGCAFVIEIVMPFSSSAGYASEEVHGSVAMPQSIWIFVRLFETRNFVDVVILGETIAAINAPEASAASIDIIERLQCDTSAPLTLCPYCCASDVYVRCGAAHLFCPDNDASKAASSARNAVPASSLSQEQNDSTLASASVGLLHCSRFHSVSVATVRFGLFLGDLGRNEMPPLYPIACVTPAQELAEAASSSKSESLLASSVETADSSLPGPSLSRVRDRLPWQQVTSAGFALMPDGNGRVLSLSFFVSTLQLAVDDIMPHHFLEGLNSAIDAVAAVPADADPVYEASIMGSGGMQRVSLKLVYRIGDLLGGKQIADIYACARANTVLAEASSTSSSPTSSSSSQFILEHPHTFSEGDPVMLCVRVPHARPLFA